MAIFDTAGRDRKRIVEDPINTQISVSFERDNAAFISTTLAPVVRVNTMSGRYRVFPRHEYAEAFQGAARAPGSRANEIVGERPYAEDGYFISEQALEMPIPDEEREENPGENVDAEAVEQLTAAILIAKEVAVRDALYDAANYKANHVLTLGAGEHFDEYGTSDPLAVFREAFRVFHEDTGILPNVGVLPWKTMSWLEDHPDLIAKYAATGGRLTPERIAEQLGLQRILVPGAVHNENSNPGLTASISEIWGNNGLLAYVPSRPAKNTPALAYEFLKPISRGRNGPDNSTLDVRRDDDNIQDIHRIRRRGTVKLVGRDPDLAGTPVVSGYLIKDLLTAANA